MTHEVVEGTCLILRALLSYILTDSFKLSRRSLFSVKYIYIYIYKPKKKKEEEEEEERKQRKERDKALSSSLKG
jgi:hypothetical protein